MTEMIEKIDSNFRLHISQALSAYFSGLNRNEPIAVHSVALKEMEAALYEAVMKFARGNQSKAAKILGVSRGTLRTKLKAYFRTTHVGLVGYED